MIMSILTHSTSYINVWVRVSRCRSSVAHRRQSRPDSSLGFQAKVLEAFQVVPLRSEAVRGTQMYVLNKATLSGAVAVWNSGRHSTLSLKNNHFTEMCSGSDAGSYLRLIDSCITQLEVQGPSQTCNERKKRRISHCHPSPHQLLCYVL